MDNTDLQAAFTIESYAPNATGTDQNSPLEPMDIANKVSDIRAEQAEQHEKGIDDIINKVEAVNAGSYFDRLKSYLTGLGDKVYNESIQKANDSLDENLDSASEINEKKTRKMLKWAGIGGVTAFGINIASIGGVAALGAATFSLPWAVGIGGAIAGGAAIKSAIENKKQKAAEYQMKREERNVLKLENQKIAQAQEIENRLNQSNDQEAQRIVENITLSTENIRNQHTELTKKIAETINEPKRDALGEIIEETNIQKLIRALRTTEAATETSSFFNINKRRNIFEELKDQTGNGVNSDSVMRLFAKKLKVNENNRGRLKVALIYLQDMPIPVDGENLTFSGILQEGSTKKLSAYFKAFKEYFDNMTPEHLLSAFTGSDFRNVSALLPTEEVPGQTLGTRPAGNSDRYDLKLYQRFRMLTGMTANVGNISIPTINPQP